METQEDTNKKVDDVMKAIEIATVGALENKEGINLLSIVKKLNRNRRKGEPLE